MYKIEDLEKMSIQQLVLLASDLQIQLEDKKTTKKSIAGVYNSASGNIVRNFVKEAKNRLRQEEAGGTK